MQQQAQLELWVLEAQAGNIAAFEKLYQHFTPQVSAYLCKHTQNQSLVQDALQEAWLSLAKQLKRLDDPAAFKSWLFKQAHWKLVDMLRRQKAAPRGVEDITRLADAQQLSTHPSTPPTDMASALARLGSTEKDIIHLFYLEGFSLSDIAQILAIPTGTVKSRLYRARQQLQALLKEE